MEESEKRYRRGAFYRLLQSYERDKWAKINDKFAKSDSPAGCVLTSVGCMKRFEHVRDEERVDKRVSERKELGNNIEDWKERTRLEDIEPGMSMNQIQSILNPKEETDL